MSIDHRSEALRLAEESHGVLRPNDEGPCEADRLLTEAQVHATLARDEEQAANTADMRDALTLLRRRAAAMNELVSQHIAKGLASREKDRWRAALELAKALDEADCNLDHAIDSQLADDGWDPRSAWKDVSTLKPGDDPWAPTPDVTGEIPDRVRRALVEYLAAALLSKGDAQGVGQTITFALKHAGADLTGDIEKQISSIALGRDPSEPPF
jgi:hypothetical protein